MFCNLNITNSDNFKWITIKKNLLFLTKRVAVYETTVAHRGQRK